ncbi:CPCC family cysteine-rich protein [Streptomyces sp. NBC_00154]|uniref:CPCC family cysteine-rich protein n=1 Tax=Streptomyces sp. NBC_00154 TaxID=2975670 RepID=UPI002257428A|nr:CPCC family cysteine-rich protein [Streptomyces sp. NBC_00154]MCX5316995.1 CPCC family cysteine-rich protein [Streptomyces sp. NBC_00154]
MVTPFVNIHGTAEGGPYRCPCCGFITLGERRNYEVCSACFWEDDGQDDHDADRGPNGRLSLTEARRNFHAMGACDERCTQFVRAPRPDEHPLA